MFVCKYLIIEEFKSELESNGIELSVDCTDECAHIEDMCADAITQFYIRFQAWHIQYAGVQALLLNHAQEAVERTKKDERRLVGYMASPILTRGVEPVSVEQLECTADFVVPSFRNVPAREVNEINKIHIVHLGKHTASQTVAHGTYLVEFYLLLDIEFPTFVFVGTSHHTLQATFVVEDESRHARTHVHLPSAVHVIIQTRCPLHTDAGCKTVVARWNVVLLQLWPDKVLKVFLALVNQRTPVHGSTYLYQQSVDRLYRVEHVQVNIPEVIQLHIVEAEKAVGQSAQLIQNHTAVDAVTVTDGHFESAQFFGPILVGHATFRIQFLVLEVITYLRSYLQHPSAWEQAIVLEFLLVRYPFAMAIVEHHRIDERRTFHASESRNIYIVVSYEHIAQLSPELGRFRLLVFFFRLRLSDGIPSYGIASVK